MVCLYAKGVPMFEALLDYLLFPLDPIVYYRPRKFYYLNFHTITFHIGIFLWERVGLQFWKIKFSSCHGISYST